MIVVDNQGIYFSLEIVGVVEELVLFMLEVICIFFIFMINVLEAVSEFENLQIWVVLLVSDRSVCFIIENICKKEELNFSIFS